MLNREFTDEEVRDFLQAYGVGARKALGIEPSRIHVKGGEGREGLIVALTIDGEPATESQLATVRSYLQKAVLD